MLREIGALSSETSPKWVNILRSDDFDEFGTDNRGGKHGEEFYDIYPKLGLIAKAHAIEHWAKKSADFTSLGLAIFC